MRIRMSIDAGGLRGSVAQLTEVLVEAREGTTFDELRSGLVAGAGLPGPANRLSFLTDGRAVPPHAVVGEPPLVHGVLLRAVSYAGRPAPGDPSPASGPGLLELQVVSGPGAGRTVRIGSGIHVIGRSGGCGIRLEDSGVSRAHTQLEVCADGVTVRDLEPTNPSHVQGQPVEQGSAPLGPGDLLRLGSTTLVLRTPERAPAQTTSADGRVRVHRPPRFPDHVSPRTVTFPAGPPRPEGHRLPLVAATVPLVIAAGLAYATGSPMMLLFGVMSPVMMLGQWLGDRRHGRVSHRRALAQHRSAVDALREEVATALRRERDERRRESPDLGIVGRVACTPEATLWQRRAGDDDHLVLRVGLGAQAARLRLEGEVPAELDSLTVDDVPVLVDLADCRVAGISGPRARVLSQAAAVVLQLATWHSPKDVRLMVFTTSVHPDPEWGWSSWLPHVQPLVAGARVASVVSASDETSTQEMVAELQLVAAQGRDNRPPGAAPSPPSVVVVLDGAHDLRLLPGVADLLRDSPGICWVCLDEIAERLPAETAVLVALGAGRAPRATVRRSDRVDRDVVPDLPTRVWVEQVARALAPLEDSAPDADTRSLPALVGFRALHRDSALALDPTDPVMLARHWSLPARPRTALLGLSTSGPYAVDLLADGPHVLVGGTTGSGKSELLQSLIAGLAVAHHPEELGFVLVDYKGGSAFKDCARLPHALGLVTDLDEHLSSRALTSLGAELKRRERILAEHGAKDLAEYARTRAAGPPLPRLVLVVDEFKMLADELPQFVDGLVRLAAVGRSLGVHLVLATQRPGGIVTGDMRANISLRIALRMRDRSDSSDVIESPDAASISDRTPGRALIRSAHLSLDEVQTAHVGRPEQDVVLGHRAGPAVWPLTWSDLSAEPPRAVDAPEVSTGRTELAAFIEAAREAARSLGALVAPSPWLPPLPDRLRVDSLAPTDADTLVPLGLRDRPHEQRQDTYCWDLEAGHLAVMGGSRSGRTTALRTVAVALATTLRPDELHLHVLEGTPGALGDLAALPHVGTIAGTDDPRRARRLVTRLLDELAGRPSGEGGCRRVVLLVDGWESLEDAFDSIDHGAPTDELLRLMREGLAAGLSIAVTGGRALASGRVSSLLQQRLVLAMPDPLDLTLAGIAPASVPARQGAGRAIEPREGCEVQLAHVGTAPEAAAQREAVAEAGARLSATYAALSPGALSPGALSPGALSPGALSPHTLPWRIRPLPEHVPLDALPTSAMSLLVGLGGDDLAPQGFDLRLDHRRLLVAGPPRSGRSTALLCLAEQCRGSGRALALVTTRRSPLSQLGGLPGVRLLGAGGADAFVDLRREIPDLAVLVDDAEGLEGTPLEAALIETARLADAARGLVAVAVDAHRAQGLFRGLVPEIARHATGLLLGARSPADGELFRMRVDPPTHPVPGRGLVIADGVATPVQVAAGNPVDGRVARGDWTIDPSPA